MKFLQNKSRVGKIFALIYSVLLLGIVLFFVTNVFLGCSIPALQSALNDDEQKSCMIVMLMVANLITYSSPFLILSIFLFYYIGFGVEKLFFKDFSEKTESINKKSFFLFVAAFIMSILFLLQIFYPQFNFKRQFRSVVPCSPNKQVDATVMFRQPISVTVIGEWEKQYGVVPYSYRPDIFGVGGNMNREVGQPFDDFLLESKKRFEDVFSSQITSCEYTIKEVARERKNNELGQITAEFCREAIEESKQALEIVRASGPTVASFNGMSTVENWRKLEKNPLVEYVSIDGYCK